LFAFPLFILTKKAPFVKGDARDHKKQFGLCKKNDGCVKKSVKFHKKLKKYLQFRKKCVIMNHG